MPEEPAILYFPGMHRQPDELHELFTLLQAHTGRAVLTCPVPYDVGEFTPAPFVEWLSRAGAQTWWVGLSLGASLAWLLTKDVPEAMLPKRLILINPFANRRELAKTVGFSMQGQWELAPEQVMLPPSVEVDLVISRQDMKIPLDCKRSLFQQMPDEGMVHFLQADHALSAVESQRTLFQMLFLQ